ncbi:MAG: molecular chaperone Hsp70, partial [Novipirellula sp. JB048]
AGESGFQEFGLPYAADAAITRHLAEFLHQHRRTGLDETGLDEQDQRDADRPDLVLFNGGVMSAPAVRERIVGLLSRWFSGDDPDWSPRVLDAPRLDLAVAQGAAYYAGVRRGHGVRIAANLGRSYYMQVADHPPQALCLIPGTAEAGQRFRADGHPLELQIGTPVQFPLWVSSTRLADSVGELVEMDRKEASPLPPICTALVHGRRRQNETIQVVIEAELSEIGTLGLYCVDTQSSKRWRLEFDIRSTLETDRDAHTGSGEAAGIVDSETVAACAEAIEAVFGDPNADEALKPNRLIKRLQAITQTHRNDWPPSLLRDQWQFMFDHAQGRRKSAQHEARWLNHVGYCLRPGYGVAVDDWRVSQVWRTVHNKLAFPAASSRTESMILWRRIAGGLTAGQQAQLAAPWISVLKNGSRKVEAHEASEAWRLFGSLERLPVGDKVTLGRVACAALGQKKNEKIRHALLWAIGRLGSRQPLYGPLNGCVGANEVARWAESLIQFDRSVEPRQHDSMWMLALVQIVRMTGDRYRDLPTALRNEVIDYLEARSAPAHSIELLRDVGRLCSEEEAAIFGDSLPLGIRLVR